MTLIAAIALLVAGAGRVTRFSRVDAHNVAEGASSRVYLDQLVGPARGRSRAGTLRVLEPADATVSDRATIHEETER